MDMKVTYLNVIQMDGTNIIVIMEKTQVFPVVSHSYVSYNNWVLYGEGCDNTRRHISVKYYLLLFINVMMTITEVDGL